MLPIGLVPHGIHVILCPKEFFFEDWSQGTNVKHPFFQLHSTAGIKLFSYFLRAFSFDRNVKYVVELITRVIAVLCPNSDENVSSSYIRSLWCILQIILTLPLPYNHVVFLPKQTQSVIQSGFIWKSFSVFFSDYWFISPSAFLSRCIPPLQGQMWNLKDGSVWEAVQSAWTKQHFIILSSLRWICEAHTSAQHVRSQLSSDTHQKVCHTHA